MPKQHKVREGEGVSKIAFDYGFFPDTVWNDPGNAALRAKREDMDILAPGDVVVIPDKRLKEETRNTGASYRFQRRGVPAVLRIQVTVNDEIRANQPFEVLVDGKTKIGGTTDADGVAIAHLSPASRKVVLRVGPDGIEIPVQIGFVRPLETLEGIKSRLNNLGFICGAGDEADEMTQQAIRDFQEQVGLTVNGDWKDEATRQRLRSLHDTTEDFPEEPGGIETSSGRSTA